MEDKCSCGRKAVKICGEWITGLICGCSQCNILCEELICDKCICFKGRHTREVSPNRERKE